MWRQHRSRCTPRLDAMAGRQCAGCPSTPLMCSKLGAEAELAAFETWVPQGCCAHLDDVLAGAVVHLRVRVVVCGGGVHAARHLKNKRITVNIGNYFVAAASMQPAACAQPQAPLSLDSEMGIAADALQWPGMLAAAALTPASTTTAARMRWASTPLHLPELHSDDGCGSSSRLSRQRTCCRVALMTECNLRSLATSLWWEMSAGGHAASCQSSAVDGLTTTSEMHGGWCSQWFTA